tara:strand:- start:29076 stop:29537 length:462 start_codon:yes stop_codon:yes gene_type:complete
MGLKANLEQACIDSVGNDAVNTGNCATLAQAQADAIVDWITSQTFRIVEMKAILEVEKMTTTAPYQADVLPTVMVAPGIPTVGSPAAQSTVAPGPLQGGSKGVLVPKVNFSKTGGQGGALQSKGYSYIGNNPVGETNEKKTKVKLLREDLVDL